MKAYVILGMKQTEAFQAAGVTTLIYDQRALGESEGKPRNDIDPMKQVSDYSDALTYPLSLPIIDPSKVSFWGQSFGGTVALCAAALDKRAKSCIAICPFLDFDLAPGKLLPVLAKTHRDRKSQLASNLPAYAPVLNEAGENPAGLGIGTSKEDYDYIINTKSRAAPNYENRTTFYKITMWQPHAIVRHLAPTPVLIIVPENDQISAPKEQYALFETFPEPKTVHTALFKGHMNVLSGEDLPELTALQVEFITTKIPHIL